MMKLIWRSACALAVVGGLSACTPAQPTAMVADVSQATIIGDDNPLKQSISTTSMRDGRSSPVADDVIAKSPLAEALRLSLTQHTLLGGDTAPMVLDVLLLQENIPFAGTSFTVSHVIRYTMMRDGAAVFEETVNSTHTVPFSESFLGATRARLAVEGSAKKNITAFIEKLVAASKEDPAKFGPAQVSQIRVYAG